MKWDGKQVLVIGGAGFLGSQLVRRLLEKNADVTVFDNFSTGKREYIPSECRLIEGDISAKNPLDSVHDIDYVFHFGSPASIILFNKNPEICAYTTLNGFINVLEWSKQNSIEKVVYPSSGSVYGNTPLPQHEDMEPKPANLYGVYKLICERIAKSYSETVPSSGLRIFAGYGPSEDHKGGFASVVTLFLNSIIKSKQPIVYGDGTQSRDFVYIEDIIQAVLTVAENDIKGSVVNVGSGKAYQFNDIISIINNLLGKDTKPIYINKPVNYLENTQADITRMKNLLHIYPLDLKDGLKNYLSQKGIIGE